MNFPYIKHRQGKSMLIPYIEFNFVEKNSKDTSFSIHKVIVGPAPHKELSKRSVISILSCNNVRHQEVKLSDIPYRGEWI